MEQSPATAAETFKFLKTFHGALLASVFLYAFVVFRIPAQNPHPPDSTFVTLLGGTSIAILGIALFFRMKNIRPALRTLRIKPDDGAALMNWRKWSIVSTVFAECVPLYGVAIHFMGGSYVESTPFFVLGLVAMLMWRPTQS